MVIQVTAFKGLCVVNFDDSLFAEPAAIQFARGRMDRGLYVGMADVQAIDFRAAGGPVVLLGVDHYSGGACAGWAAVATPDQLTAVDSWPRGRARDYRLHICSRESTALFGQSHNENDLTQLKI